METDGEQFVVLEGDALQAEIMPGTSGGEEENARAGDLRTFSWRMSTLGRLTTLLPVGTSERMAAKSSKRIGLSLGYPIHWEWPRAD